MQEVRVMFKH